MSTQRDVTRNSYPQLQRTPIPREKTISLDVLENGFPLSRVPANNCSPIWCRLISLNPLFNNIDVTEHSVILGRAHGTCGNYPVVVSDRHCKLYKIVKDGKIYCKIVDISKNGTYVNGERIPDDQIQSRLLATGDEISLGYGDYKIRLQHGEAYVAYYFQLLIPNTIKSSVNDSQLSINSTKKAKGKDNPLKRKISTPTSLIKRTRSFADGLDEIDEYILKKKRKLKVNAFYKISIKNLEFDRNVTQIQTFPNKNYSIIQLKRPSVTDSSYGANEFKKVELAFRRFVNKDLIYQVEQVDVIVNKSLQKKFEDKLEQLQNVEKVDQLSEWQDNSNEMRTLKHLFNHLNQYTDISTEKENLTNISRSEVVSLCWHGTNINNIETICEKGFVLSNKNDEGWYGNGFYFTQMPSYCEYYIEKLRQPGKTSQMILSWVILGKVFPVTDFSLVGKPCVTGYDSHYALVKQFSVVDASKSPNGDEIVVFDEAQILPRYVVHFSSTSREPFVPDTQKV